MKLPQGMKVQVGTKKSKSKKAKKLKKMREQLEADLDADIDADMDSENDVDNESSEENNMRIDGEDSDMGFLQKASTIKPKSNDLEQLMDRVRKDMLQLQRNVKKGAKQASLRKEMKKLSSQMNHINKLVSHKHATASVRKARGFVKK